MNAVLGLGWVTWRQHRVQLVAAGSFVAAIGALMLFHRLHTTGLAEQFASGSTGRREVLQEQFGQVARVLVGSAVPPALVGLFWGTPLLAREFERGTHRLAWTQSVTRRAWLGVKLSGLGAAVAIAGLLFGLIMGGWAGEFAELRGAGRLANLDLFMVTGIVPAGWWLFAFALGTASGAVLRKLLPAMAVTLAVFFTLYIGLVTSGLRLHYTEPVRVEVAAPRPVGEPWSINTPAGAEARLPVGALLVASGWTDRAGTTLSSDATWGCAYDAKDYLGCMRDKGFRWFAEYQPADRYWRFQLTETGALLALSLGLGALTLRRAH